MTTDIRRYIELMESQFTNTFIHGSAWKLPLGAVLMPHGDGLVHSSKPAMRKTEYILEQRRPKDMLARGNSVYMTDTTDAKVIAACGGYTNYLYRVAPLDGFERNHLGWWQLINRSINAYGPDDPELADMDTMLGWAEMYWSGEPCDLVEHKIKKPLSWEYRTFRARVMEFIGNPHDIWRVPNMPAGVKRWLSKTERDLKAE